MRHILAALVIGAAGSCFAQLPTIPITPTVYGNLKSKQVGPILQTPFTPIKRLGAMLNIFAGTTSKTSHLSDFTGVIGGDLDWTWTLMPKKPWQFSVGLAVSENAGQQFGAGVVLQLAYKL
jgi:hypothetical protein